MAVFPQLLVVCALVLPGAVAVTPVEKVISLLEDLKAEIEGEGISEAETYNDFACFCKDQTKTKSSSILNGRDEIDRLSAEIQKNTAEKEDEASEVQRRKAKQEELSSELDATKAQHAKDRAEYNAVNADLTKALSSLQAAKKALSEAKPTPSSLLAIRESIKPVLALADAMKMIEMPKQQTISAFFQVDPENPDYKFHSQGILDMLEKLLKDFRAQHAEVTSEWEKTDKTAKDTIKSLDGEMTTNSGAITQGEENIEGLNGLIASDKTSLINEDGALKDDKLYLKDLTARCEARANDWDQRTQARAGELTAISSALTILKDNVTVLDTAANKRALLQRGQGAASGKRVQISSHIHSPMSKNTQILAKAVSFLQETSASDQKAQARQDHVANLLQKEASRIGSTALANIAAHAGADPFAKVKELIQKLIERLVGEATSEATKKGFCDEALGKAIKDRDFRFEDSRKLNTELKVLETKQDELESEIAILKEDVIALKDALKNATELRAVEKKENLQTMKDAKAGHKAVSEAMIILKVYYKEAAKASLLQASPVDEDTQGAGFSGSYRGKQTASKGIIGLLEVIQTDFARTLRTTEAAEAKSHADFVEFDRTSRTDIRGKETKQALDEEDLSTTKNKIVDGMADLQTAVDLLDAALKTLEDLKPTCIDTGMSYADRVAKREEEMRALKKALCILDTENVEADCA